MHICIAASRHRFVLFLLFEYVHLAYTLIPVAIVSDLFYDTKDLVYIMVLTGGPQAECL